jgi:hypothetical protein
MRIAILATAVAAVVLVLVASAAHARPQVEGWPLGLELLAAPAMPGASRLEGDVDPTLLLAQRTIEREWMTRADSLENPGYLRGGKSEIAALALSAAMPGAGQLYVGERGGLAYLAAEIVTVASAIVIHRKADDYRDKALQVAGSPEDSASGWSFERWADATHADPAELRALYQADREAFYQRIGGYPTYEAGWASTGAHAQFTNWRDVSDQRLHTARNVTVLTWVNHLVASVDALRAARFFNLPLRRAVEIKGNAGWKHGSPTVRVAVLRRF